MRKDDTLHTTKAPEGDNRPQPKDSEEARQKALAEEIMDEDREVLRALAPALPLSAAGRSGAGRRPR